MQASLSGDGRSLELLFKRYFRPIYGYVSLLVGQRDADDVAQEAFVRAWRHLASFDASRPFKTWLYRIAHNAAVDFLRKKRPASFSDLQSEDSPAFEETVADDALPMPEIIDRKMAMEVLHKALDGLPKKQREALTLHYLDELSFTEIAELSGEPVDTVKSRSRRALMALKKALAS